MNKYRVRVLLDEEYDDIEADSEEEASDIASDFAISMGSWSTEIELLEEQEDELMSIYMFVYTFADGIVLKLYEAGLSLQEIKALESLHGKAKTERKKVEVSE